MKQHQSRPAIEVKNVKKTFYLPHHQNDSIKTALIQSFRSKSKGGKTFNALDGVTFEVKKGDFFGILGRNGSGKSTLLKIISEIYQPTNGSVKRDGRLVSFIELGVGFKSELTGRENVFLNGALLGFSKHEIESMYSEIVAFAELEKFMDQRLKNYSSGMKVRLAFSVAIRAKADILILDEVLAVGDAAFKKKCNEYFKTLKHDKKTVVLVTHSMRAVREFCTRAILIEDGKVAFEGSGEEAADKYLKLFDEEALIEKGGIQYQRWGDNAIRIEEFDVEVKSDTIRVSAQATAGDDSIDDVMFGFRFKTLKGKVLMGANNLNIHEGKPLSFKANETKKLIFEMPNVLANKEYSVSATINSSNGAVTHDWWEDITTIKNTRESVRYPLVAPATFSTESVDSQRQ